MANNRKLVDYVDEVTCALEKIGDEFPNEEENFHLTLLNFAINMRNADYMNQNVFAEMSIKEDK